MKTYILVGEAAVNHFNNDNFEELEELILGCNGGDIIAWDSETQSVSELLEELNGWHNFIELSSQDLEEIKNLTKIEIK